MLDHLSMGVSDFQRGAAFYDAVLEPLGMTRVMDFANDAVQAVAYGADGKPVFWIGAAMAGVPPVTPMPGFHLAFAAPDRAAVDAFYGAAMAAGAKDNGAPGLRPHYHPHYYAAFVLDPDGHHMEAVCHRPED